MNGPGEEFGKRSRRPFIQPLAMALVFALFALLFFAMAMMDLGRLERLLMDSLQKKALYVVSVIEKGSLEKYRHIARDAEGYGFLSTNTGITDQSFSLQEALARALIDVADHADREAEQPVAREDKIRKLASSEHLQAIGLFDNRGILSFESAPIGADITTAVSAMLERGEDITIHLFHGIKAPDSPIYVATRKRSGMGAVVLVLDRQGLEFWGLRVATQAAVEELQWGMGVAYLSIEDKDSQILARFGIIARDRIEECILAAGTARAKANADVQCVKVGDTKFLELSFPFALEGRIIGIAHVGLETHETDQLLLENQRRIFIWTGLMVLIGLFAMWTLYRTQNLHIAKLQAMRERLFQAERLSSLGKLAAGVAHEIRNPLNAISMAAQRLQHYSVHDASDKKEKFERISLIIGDEIRRLDKIVEDFLSLSRSNRMEWRPQPIAGLLDRVLFLLQAEAGPRDIQVEKQWTNLSFMVLMDAGKMEQALLNIVRNAMESISGQGRITISCSVLSKDLASIKIEDTGKGVPAGEEKRIFDPFYTSKENGVGLGLAIAHEIVSAHGGEIRVKSEVGKGSTFEILLPIQA